MKWIGLRPAIVVAIMAVALGACWALTVTTTNWAAGNRDDALGRQVADQVDADLSWIQESLKESPSATRFEDLSAQRRDPNSLSTEAVLIPIATLADGIRLDRAHQYAYVNRTIPLTERVPECVAPPSPSIQDIRLDRMNGVVDHDRCGGYIIARGLLRTSELFDVQYWLVVRALDPGAEPDPVPDLEETLVNNSIYIGLAALLVAVVLAWAVAEPLTRARAMAEAVANGDLSRRVPVQGRDEVARFSGAVNQMADRLTRQISDLEHANETQRRFVSDVAHELRTPTAALLASAEALEHAETREEAAALVAPQLRRLAGLTEDLLEISRMDAGRAEVMPTSFDLMDLVTEVVGDSGSTGVHLVGTFPIEVCTDPVRLRVIVRNLVANALQHGAAPVTVAVDQGERFVSLAVTDAGGGVAPDLRERVFDRFVRGDEARHGTSSGLGLAIAAENARLLGGTLTLDEDGRTFRLELPR